MLYKAAVRAQEMNARLRLTVDVWARRLLRAVRQPLGTLSTDVQRLFVGHPDSGPPTFLLKYLFRPYLLAPELSLNEEYPRGATPIAGKQAEVGEVKHATCQ